MRVSFSHDSSLDMGRHPSQKTQPNYRLILDFKEGKRKRREKYKKATTF